MNFIESAVGCFSPERNIPLMFSHYAEKHTGICIGFDTQKLIESIDKFNDSIRADLRPIWYLPTLPNLDLINEPALCATVKWDVWSYEKEYRLFVRKNGALVASQDFKFDRAAIREVIIGCKATDECISISKAFTNDLPSCTRYKAYQVPNRFELNLTKITW